MCLILQYQSPLFFFLFPQVFAFEGHDGTMKPTGVGGSGGIGRGKGGGFFFFFFFWGGGGGGGNML